MKSRGRVSLTLMMALLVVLTACDGDADKWNERSIRGLMPDLAFSLTDENGRAVYVFDDQGRARLMIVDTGDPSAIAQDLRRLALKAIDSY